MNMEYSETGLHLTQGFESCRLVAYWDDLGKVWTIGWGHTRRVREGQTCTQAQADDWLQFDLGYSTAAVNHLVHAQLTQNEFDALVDFVFNLGVENFATSTLLELLNHGAYAAAAAQFDKWDHASGKVVQGLLRRREAEAAEFNA